MSLLEEARTGLRELPANAGWLLSRVLGPVDAADAAAKARERARRVVDATLANEDSTEMLIRRSQEAADRARDAEERAVAAAQEAKERSEHALEVSERGRARVKDVDRETGRQLQQRIKQAEKDAEETLRREREEATVEAEERRRTVHSEVKEESERSRREAEEAQRRAEQLVEEAQERMAEARRLANEAAAAARAEAERAGRHAEQLEADARQQAAQAEARVDAADDLRARSEATTQSAVRRGSVNGGNGDLGSYNKAELVELAAGIGIRGRTTMTKTELVDAIEKTSARARRRRSR